MVFDELLYVTAELLRVLCAQVHILIHSLIIVFDNCRSLVYVRRVETILS